RVTVFFGAFEIQRCSSSAIQSGAPGMSNSAMGCSAVTGIFTPGVETPGFGFGAGRGAACCCENMVALDRARTTASDANLDMRRISTAHDTASGKAITTVDHE